MHNFAALEKMMAANPALYARTHLLSISFDPEHDTPERLRAYGATYMGSDAKNCVCALGVGRASEAGAH
jgi:protein SCO1/2